jgi:prepilin-type N-terminal cleavage/methylation domain-containing protein
LRPAIALGLITSRNYQQGRRSQASEQGLTLIECLVAIVIITLTVVAITPPIMLATASRIQSRKVEKANQVAQGELDRVRLLVERGTYALNDLPGTTGAINSASNISSFGAATGSPTGGLLYSTASCNTYPGTTPVGVTDLIRVDVDGDCTPEYVMQVFRTPGYAPTPPAITATSVPFSFEMGVRVYAYYPPPQAFLPLDTTKASLRMGTGPLDIAGGKRRPMAVLYSKMARNDSSRSLGQLCIQNGGTTAACSY